MSETSGHRFITNDKLTLEIREELFDDLRQVGLNADDPEAKAHIDTYIVLTDTKTNKNFAIHRSSTDNESPFIVDAGISFDEAKEFMVDLAKDREQAISFNFNRDSYQVNPLGKVRKVNK